MTMIAHAAPARRSVFGPIRTGFSVLGAALAVSSDLKRRRLPDAEDLRTLGIDPAAFANVIR